MKLPPVVSFTSVGIGASGEIFSAPYLLPDGTETLLATGHGVFSKGHVDAGSLTLLAKAPPPPSAGNLLDIGCGYGPIALSLALRAPQAKVWAVDVNPRARDLTLANAERLGVPNIEVLDPSEVPSDVRFSAIYSNPPLHTGKSDLHDLLDHWLARLEETAKAWLVVKKSRGSDSLMRWLAERGHVVTKLASKRGFRVIEVGRRS